MKNFEKLFKKVGFEISDKDLLREAFTHRSAVNELSNLKFHNERLEFLGDAVLELFATDFLFNKFPEEPEGVLTSLRSALVKGEHLAEVAARLDLGDYLILSKGEERSGGRDKEYLLANLLEAFIGAIYLNKDFVQCRGFVENFVLSDVDEILASGAHIDAKSEFQEISQSLDKPVTPHYKVLSDEGKDHAKTFVMGAYLGEVKVGEGTGRSKKEAQVVAAQDALDNRAKWVG
ncbi:MAG: ribonuclease III [Candidatus Peregrinibacteria bacterium]|nr:ribonuclease III [Candidatus Peregrinibacteria bacterium]